MSNISLVQSKSGLDAFTVPDIKLALHDRKLQATGKKDELIERLWQALLKERSEIGSLPAPKASVRRSPRFSPDSVSAESSQSSKSADTSILRDIILTLTFLLIYLAFLVYFFYHFPGLDPNDRKQGWEAWSKMVSQKGETLKHMQTFVKIARHYTHLHYVAVVFGIGALYNWYQTFAVFLLWMPGSASILSIVSGALLGWQRGFILCLFLACLGTICSYSLFYWIGRPLAVKWYGKRIKQLGTVIEKHRHHLFFWLLFLRLTPFIPNFLINMASPIIDIPLHQLLLATVVGLIPNTVILVSLGASLETVGTLSQGIWTFVGLTVLGLLCLLPSLLVNRYGVTDELKAKDE